MKAGIPCENAAMLQLISQFTIHMMEHTYVPRQYGAEDRKSDLTEFLVSPQGCRQSRTGFVCYIIKFQTRHILCVWELLTL